LSRRRGACARRTQQRAHKDSTRPTGWAAAACRRVHHIMRQHVGLVCTMVCAARLLSPVATGVMQAPTRVRCNHSLALSRPVIAKRIRWFIDDSIAGMTDKGNLDFVFGTHADVVDGIYPCCGWGHVHGAINGSFLAIRDESNDPVETAARQATDKFYQRLRESGRSITPTLSGDNFPVSAFRKREEFASEVLAVSGGSLCNAQRMLRRTDRCACHR